MACAPNTTELNESNNCFRENELPSVTTATAENIVNNLYDENSWHSHPDFAQIPNAYKLQSPLSIDCYLATNPTLSTIIKDNSDKTLHFICMFLNAFNPYFHFVYELTLHSFTLCLFKDVFGVANV